jgi:hypothetical protein
MGLEVADGIVLAVAGSIKQSYPGGSNNQKDKAITWPRPKQGQGHHKAKAITDEQSTKASAITIVLSNYGPFNVHS